MHKVKYVLSSVIVFVLLITLTGTVTAAAGARKMDRDGLHLRG